MTKINNDVALLLGQKIAALKNSTLERLQGLPETSEESHSLGSTRVTVVTWRENLPDETLRIAVKVCWKSPFPGFMGFNQTDGFRVSPRGEISALTSDELIELS